MSDLPGRILDWLHLVFVAQIDYWIVLGFVAQFLFMMRFVVQWIASERARRSVVPVAFWFFSLGGGVLLLVYAVQRQDPVFIAGQALGLLIYLRNLSLIFRKQPSADPAIVPDGAEKAG
ncbi:lipid-A-disaccharide synthase N-terminal domain-containing protein [Methylobrevis pamukkalensis]|uniref:Lipid-A-disaccharide synthase n=1 Tax=Methylobrevis pamukkalensis TaxID=1439726 RepID=A0A1E3H2U8_9HYPH|nr:lipid-A-disaccharide synthase N-terminal domain-containing protein [Methylobrevis pamukkalensis]ODN70136.1 lipid-A-disaccharide synthase [Methylobrevis pamukkalensis]